MAIFNPDVPNKDAPIFLNWAKENKEPMPNEAGKYTGEALATELRGAGNALETGVKTAYDFTEETIKGQVEHSVDTVRDAMTSALQATNEKLLAGGSSSVAPTQPTSLVAGYGDTDLSKLPSSIPAPLKAGLDKVPVIGAAIAAKPQMELYYNTQLNDLAKYYRTQYPGFRDYIDATIAKTTGVNPANELVQKNIDVLNAITEKQRANREKDVDEIRKNYDIAGQPAVMQKIENGTWTIQQGREWLTANTQWKNKIALEEASWKSHELGNKWDQEKAEKDFGLKITGDGQAAFQALKADGPNGTSMAQFAKDVADGKRDDVDEIQIRNLTQMTVASRKAFFTKQMTEATKPQFADGKSWADRLGGADKAAALINQRMAPLWDNVIDAWTHRDYGRAEYYQKINEADVNAAFGGMLKDDDVRQWALTMSAMGKWAPNKEIQEVFNTSLANNFDTGFKHWVEQRKMVARTAWPNSVTGEPPAAAEHIKEIKDSGETDPRVPVDYLKVYSDIANPEKAVEGRKNLIRTFFGNKNLNILDNFKADYYDPTTKRVIPGSNTLYANMTSPLMMKEAHKITRDEPQLWEQVKDWSEQSFAFKIMRNEMATIREIQNDPTQHISWNDDTKNPGFDLVDVNGKPMRGPKAVGPLAAIGKVNSGFKNLAYMYSLDGEKDVSGKMIQFLTANGIQMDDKMIKAITEPVRQKASQAAPDAPGSRKTEEPRDTSPINNYVQEDDRKALEALFSRFDSEPKQLILDRSTGKYVPYERGYVSKGKVQDRVNDGRYSRQN